MTIIDYKETLNLPKTAFPMKGNLANREPEMLKFWQEVDLYRLMQTHRQDAPKYILNDGPPYANGDIHIGHALNKILKDIIVKAKTLSGYQAPYIPGWDCHGLPIELNVEKKVGKPGDKISAKAFRKQCREYAEAQIDNQRQSFIRLGVQGDWYRPYKTMDYHFEANTIRTLAKIIENGHLHKGDKPVHWCVSCGSALAEAEVEYQDKKSHSIDVTFKVIDKAKILSLFSVQEAFAGNISFMIWTTTPWTLPANMAIALGPDIEYALIQVEQDAIIVAKALIENILQRAGKSDHKILGTCLGVALEKQMARHPFANRDVLVALGEHVTLDAGTGCVHTAPAHGLEDFAVGQQYGLEVYNPVAANGCYLDDVKYFAGLPVLKANEQVIEVLKGKDALFCHGELEHSYPHCWRHKTPLIFRATPQWFISMSQKGLREKALSEIKQVKWVPDWGQARIEGMVAGRPDWCISRQRTWGVPIAIFVHQQTGEIHPDTPKLMEKVAQVVEKEGVDGWFDLEPESLLGQEAKDYMKVMDILDVWFDSGCVHYSVLEDRKELHFPADLYLEGSDQHRGWFQTSLLSAVAMRDKAPFKTVLTHGFTVDAKGRKMSKSQGNVIAPDKVMKTLGADILRLWVAATDYRAELHVSEEILKRMSDAYRRIRNTARFLLANLDGFDVQKDIVSPHDMLKLDRWIASRAKILQQDIQTAYDDFQFHVVYQKLHNFCVNELGSFYLDVIKDRQYTGKRTGLPRRSAQTAIYHILQAMVRWMAPILSFTAEEIWQYLPEPKEKSVFISTWYTELPGISSEEVMNDDFWKQVLFVRDAVNKVLESARAGEQIGSALEAEVTLFVEEHLMSQLKHLGDELRFVLITSQAKLLPLQEKTSQAVQTELKELYVLVNCSPYEKCARCWHRREDVNQNTQYPGICSRCVENLSEKGEKRIYA